jgi:hypothetical protein
MRWVVAFFFALVFVPVAQVTADAWKGHPGPHVWGLQSHIRNASPPEAWLGRRYAPWRTGAINTFA